MKYIYQDFNLRWVSGILIWRFYVYNQLIGSLQNIFSINSIIIVDVHCDSRFHNISNYVKNTELYRGIP